MKLSKAQQEILKNAKASIDKAREQDFLTFVGGNADYFKKDPGLEAKCKKWYEDTKNGITEVACNSKTIKKLEELGLIKIIYDSNGEHYGRDIIKVLNY